MQRWTAKCKAAVVLDLIAGKTTSAEVEQWKTDSIAQGTESLRTHPRDQAAQFEARELFPVEATANGSTFSPRLKSSVLFTP